MTDASQVPEEMREMVLDPGTDDFFSKHAHLTFGEVGMSVKALLEQYQTREAQHKKVCRDVLSTLSRGVWCTIPCTGVFR